MGHLQMDTAGRGHWDCTTRGHWEKGISPHEDTGKRGFHHTGTLGEWNIHNMGTPQRGHCTAHSTYLLQHNNIPQPQPRRNASLSPNLHYDGGTKTREFPPVLTGHHLQHLGGEAAGHVGDAVGQDIGEGLLLEGRQAVGDDMAHPRQVPEVLPHGRGVRSVTAQWPPPAPELPRRRLPGHRQRRFPFVINGRGDEVRV